jgi:hypothetical protein
MSADPTYVPLLELLQQRRAVIADHAWRDRDSASHLAELQRVSEAIQQEHLRLRPGLPARLQHYLTQCSYDKAAIWITNGGVES